MRVDLSKSRFTALAWSPLVVIQLSISSCVAVEESKFTAEEFAYNQEVSETADAACLVGAAKAVRVGAMVYQQGEFDTLADTYAVVDWATKRQQLERLLPPPGLQDLHDALLRTLGFEVSLEGLNSEKPISESKNDFLLSGLGKWLLKENSKRACKLYGEFTEAVRLRPSNPEAAPTLSISFEPLLVPISGSLNSKGEFSVSVSNSIVTPYGTLSVSASKSVASASSPRLLIIRANGKERRFHLDKPFEVFVPSHYGVRVTNNSTELILEVVERAN